MMNNMKRHLLTLYTRTPLHAGSGASVDVVDLPIMRERITGFPVVPSPLPGGSQAAIRSPQSITPALRKPSTLNYHP
jgi:hypothetical protein